MELPSPIGLRHVIGDIREVVAVVRTVRPRSAGAAGPVSVD